MLKVLTDCAVLRDAVPGRLGEPARKPEELITSAVRCKPENQAREILSRQQLQLGKTRAAMMQTLATLQGQSRVVFAAGRTRCRQGSVPRHLTF